MAPWLTLRPAIQLLRDALTASSKSGPKAMSVEPALRDELLAALPSLRAYAFNLSGSWDCADDLVQDTVARAWAYMDGFKRGSNLQAWLSTILRHQFYTQQRKHRHEVEDPDGAYTTRLRTHPEQPSRLDLEDFRRALAKLPPSYREALILIGAGGLSYEEAAAICSTPAGTIKSRLSRGREKLVRLLTVTGADDIGPDQITRAAMQSS